MRDFKVEWEIILPNLPIELIVKDTLKLIGNTIGSFSWFLETDLKCSSLIIIVNMNVNILKPKLFYININEKKNSMEPRFVDGPFRDDLMLCDFPCPTLNNLVYSTPSLNY